MGEFFGDGGCGDRFSRGREGFGAICSNIVGGKRLRGKKV